MADVNTYILTGCRYLARRPLIYSDDKKPGLKRRSFIDTKNFPSKCVISSRKWSSIDQKVSFGSMFSCPQTWQYRPSTIEPQFRQSLSFLSLPCDMQFFF